MGQKKILVQGEANNSLSKDSYLFFYSEHDDINVGDNVVLTNHGMTMRTNAVILDKSKKGNLYAAQVTTDDPIQDRLDLTIIM